MANFCAPSKNWRRLIPPCTYPSNRFNSSCGKSEACFRSMLGAPLASGNRRLRAQCGVDFLVGRPPIGALDLGDAIADDLGRRLYLVEAAGIAAEELGLVFDRQAVLLHRLDRSPGVVAVMMIDVG